ncbi:membrane protein of ER body-like protein [Cucurbita pepo subsp. pepo]|uniref:membrane protein of ER body-like protein n=1 Tax=Cucurbita pepo subsp. pepo TaxID=3664 RepID=UPI000C9D6F5D|nr:membrane protein of ER body-like protein [Cucurbita pepo subsp. pepo]
MEAVIDQLAAVEAVEAAADDRKSRKKQLSRTSSSDSDEMYSGGSPKEILKLGGKAIAPTGEAADIIFIPHVIDKTLILNRGNNNSTPPPPYDVSDIGGGGGGAVGDGYPKPIEGEQELDLQTLYKLPDSHNFYCPTCNCCITKVIIRRDPPSPRLNVIPPEIRPQSPGPDAGGTDVRPREFNPDDDGCGRIDVLCSNCFSFLAPIGKWMASLFRPEKPQFPAENVPLGTDTTIGAGPSTTPGEPDTKDEGPPSFVIPIPPGGERLGQTVSRGRSLEIMKSIVYGGLTEAITSLGIVTSAASASTPTENIVALALANLITGLIVITNNISGLKSNQLKKEPNERGEAKVDSYEEALGDRQHYLLHYTIAILSFLIFGLLPPLVYGFSFRDTDDGDLKLAAVAASSLLCIALLAIAKAYAQRAQNWQAYAKTLVYYITLGFGASGLSYLAGKEFDKLLEQFGWFKGDPLPPTLLLPNMDFATPTWGSI